MDTRTPAPHLDARDIAILRVLEADGRITKSRLAERIDLSASACWERVHRLERAGLIRGYHAEIAIEALAPITTFVVQVELEQHRAQDFRRFEDAISRLPEVTRCLAVGGGTDYFLEVVTTGIDSYQRLIDDILERGIGVSRYFTFAVTKQVKRVRPSVAAILGAEETPVKSGS